MPRRRLAVPRLAALAGALVLTSCATYTERTAEARQAFQSGQFERAIELFADEKVTGSEFLAGAEAGTVALAAGDWPRAVDAFHAAAARVREHEERALVSPEAAAEQLGGFLLNEGQLPYVGEGYERVLLHALLGLAYLAQGNIEGLWVQTRRSNRLLETEEALYETRYGAGGLAHFLSAIGYELADRPDHALIDYRRMLDKGTGAELAGRAAVRVAARLHRLDDFPELVQRFGPPPELPEGAATVIVIAGLGDAPQKRESSLTLPSPWGIVRFAVPTLVSRGGGPAPLVLRLPDAGLAVDSTVVEDVDRVMRENLDHRIGWLGARTVARAGVRLVAREQLRRETGVLGALAVDVFTLVSERADLRGWTTLPAAFHAARAFVPPGAHTVELAHGGRTIDLGTVVLDPGETIVVVARSVGGRLHAHLIGGGRVPDTVVIPDPGPYEPPAPYPTAEEAVEPTP